MRIAAQSAPLKEALLRRFGRNEYATYSEAYPLFSTIIEPHKFEEFGLEGRGGLVLAGAPGQQMAMLYRRINHGLRIKIDAFDSYAIHCGLAGRYDWRIGNETGSTGSQGSYVISPGMPFESCVESHSESILIKLPKTVVTQTYRDLTGHALQSPIQFDAAFETGSGKGRSIRAILGFVVSEMARPDSLINTSRMIDTYRDLIVCSMLRGLRHTHSHRLEGPVSPAAPRQVTLAEQYIREHADQDISVTDLTDLTGVSSRSLQLAFRRFRETSPAAYIRSVRLDKACAALERGGEGQTVTTIARTWGFTHLGRFSQVYRERFGERPSETLNRAR